MHRNSECLFCLFLKFARWFIETNRTGRQSKMSVRVAKFGDQTSKEMSFAQFRVWWKCTVYHVYFYRNVGLFIEYGCIRTVWYAVARWLGQKSRAKNIKEHDSIHQMHVKCAKSKPKTSFISCNRLSASELPLLYRCVPVCMRVCLYTYFY